MECIFNRFVPLTVFSFVLNSNNTVLPKLKAGRLPSCKHSVIMNKLKGKIMPELLFLGVAIINKVDIRQHQKSFLSGSKKSVNKNMLKLSQLSPVDNRLLNL